MPAKKRTACNPRKGRLTFLESPEQGPIHEYGAAPSKADNPICVPTKLLDDNAATSWVSPQFDQAAELHFPARRRLRHTSSNNTLQSRPGDTSRNTLRVATRKQSVCKFPSLSFTHQNTTSVIQTQSFCARRQRQPKQKVILQTPVLKSPPERTCDKTVSPPDIKTPDASPTKNTSLAPATADLPTPVSRKEIAQGAANTPQGNGQVLAEDTPEHEYGVRVTWRRRKGLMKYLKSRGRLESSQIQVKL
ncbi:PREDICTED: RAD9, HUS1, RAD1-interacting nuclear orphan protein 1 [Nanorana parkeri]|uniref:RAD9, HUS1, RAD1-interacting nuclear orphan protein 1 n=1 Tax=Nanorana parkeri TaxID=125878 RepID=UPI00085495AF|nr:PREDICTED: RAD9, HUS1, RAD1-interacting nuclear orphan protein 1 [Nanorana parkeri]